MGELEEDRCACDLEMSSTTTTKSQAREVVEHHTQHSAGHHGQHEQNNCILGCHKVRMGVLSVEDSQHQLSRLPTR